MNPLETRRHDRFHSKKFCSFGRPVARGTGSIFVPGQNNERHLLFLITHCGIEDRHLLTVRIMLRHAAFSPRHHQVFNSHIRERPARHDEIVSAPASVTIEVRRLNSARFQIFAGR